MVGGVAVDASPAGTGDDAAIGIGGIGSELEFLSA